MVILCLAVDGRWNSGERNAIMAGANESLTAIYSAAHVHDTRDAASSSGESHPFREVRHDAEMLTARSQLSNKAKRIRKAKIPGFENVQSPAEASDRTLIGLYKVALTRPWVILFDPISFLVAIYMSIVYALLYMLFTIYPIVSSARAFCAWSLAYIGYDRSFSNIVDGMYERKGFAAIY